MDSNLPLIRAPSNTDFVLEHKTHVRLRVSLWIMGDDNQEK
jgi:hypothetical protein